MASRAAVAEATGQAPAYHRDPGVPLCTLVPRDVQFKKKKKKIVGNEAADKEAKKAAEGKNGVTRRVEGAIGEGARAGSAIAEGAMAD